MINSGYPALSERSRGWLRFLHRKATTPDNWRRGGQPSPLWDNRSGAPMTSWRRFDLIDSGYALALVVDTTPAWRELYIAVFDELRDGVVYDRWRRTGPASIELTVDAAEYAYLIAGD